MGVESTGNYHNLWLQIAYMTGHAIKLGLVEDFETGEEDVRGEHLRNGYGVTAVYVLHQSGRGYGCVFMIGVGRLLCVDKDRIGLTQTSHRNIKATAP